jgi:hypothetical protein
VIVSALAGYLPARRASKVDPMGGAAIRVNRGNGPAEARAADLPLGLPAESRAVRSRRERRLVRKGGVEPPKPFGYRILRTQ